MSGVFTVLKIVILAFVVIKTVAYGIWCITDGNRAGGAAALLMGLAAVALFFFNESRIYI